MRFDNREQAGRELGAALLERLDHAQAVVLALPRGGVPVAFEVAWALEAPLDVFLVRKIGVPGHEELAMGAVAEGGFRLLNREVMESAGVSEQDVRPVEVRQRRELRRQEELYRRGRQRAPIQGQVVLLVDDGLATGASMQVAVQAVAAQRPQRVVVAVPVAPPEACRALERLADEVVCLRTPDSFASVGSWYEDFGQVTDQQVCELLDRAAARQSGRSNLGPHAQSPAATGQSGSVRSAVPDQRWGSFLDDYSRQHFGWLVTLRVWANAGDARPAQVLAEQALRHLRVIESGASLEVALGSPDNPTRVAIRHPRAIWIEREADGADRGLTVENSGRIELTFRVPAVPEVLDGLVMPRPLE